MTIRWGIIGVGNVCEVKSGPALQKADGSDLVAVMRRSGDLAADYAHRHGVPRWYDDATALINDPEVDAVYIATPPDSHRDYVLAVAAAGKPIYVEKPMARTYAECQQMIRACEQADVPLFVAFYRRGLPRFNRVRELLAAGTIGAVRFVRVTMHQTMRAVDPANPPWRLVPAQSGGGLFFDLGSHMLDWLDYAFGSIVTVAGQAGNQAGKYPAEDIVTGSWVHESGVHGVGTWCFNTARQEDLFEIYGSDGVLAFSCFTEEPIRVTIADGVQEYTVANPPHIQQPLIQTIVDQLHGRGECPSTGWTAARTAWVMDQMVAAWRDQAGIDL
jgi:predicted dehydrogenase